MKKKVSLVVKKFVEKKYQPSTYGYLSSISFANDNHFEKLCQKLDLYEKKDELIHAFCWRPTFKLRNPFFIIVLRSKYIQSIALPFVLLHEIGHIDFQLKRDAGLVNVSALKEDHEELYADIYAYVKMFSVVGKEETRKIMNAFPTGKKLFDWCSKKPFDQLESLVNRKKKVKVQCLG